MLPLSTLNPHIARDCPNSMIAITLGHTPRLQLTSATVPRKFTTTSQQHPRFQPNYGKGDLR